MLAIRRSLAGSVMASPSEPLGASIPAVSTGTASTTSGT